MFVKIEVMERMGIRNVYRLTNPELFNKWSAIIEDWGSLHYVTILLPNGTIYSRFPTKSLRSAKVYISKELGGKGAKYDCEIIK
jgi:hypothetical protein